MTHTPLHPLDYSIVAAYLVGLIAISLFVARKAARGTDDYFLGGKKLPWWALGASGMSSNLDAAGTMTIISLIYLFGLHGFWIEMRGGVVLPIAVFLAFMGKWHQRSNVMTTGEWMLLRFGDTAQGRAARYTAALTYLVITVGMVVFFLAAAGKFLAVFLPFDATTCAVAMALLALGYTMISGLYGVIWTDVFQAFLIGAAAIYISVLAAMHVSPELLNNWPGSTYNFVIPLFNDGLYQWGWDAIEGIGPGVTPAESNVFFESYSPFLLFLLFWAGKGILEGLGGSGGSAYMAQRFYAAQDVPTVKKLGMLWTVLFSFRWPMVLGFAILAIHLGIGSEDPETILPGVLTSGLIPVGITGLIVAAIFAASMSTFDSTLNAGASYAVRDLYNPIAETRGSTPSEKTQVRVAYVTSILIVALGLTISLTLADNILGVWTTIVIQLFPAFLLPFALRWFWHRFNGLGFTLGTATGFAAAFSLTFLPPPPEAGLRENFGVLIQNNAYTDIFTLSTVGLASLLGCVAGTYLAPPTPKDQLNRFYHQIKPLGFWPRDWRTPDQREHTADLFRLILALVWQVSTFLLPMTLVLHKWTPAAILAAIFAFTGTLLLLDIKSTQANRRGVENAEQTNP
ncbi:MAG: sodium:solute symporter [Planctomycetota bacterium]